MSSPPTLRQPDFNKVFEIAYDAIGYGVRGVLNQEGHPIAYLNEKLIDSGRLKYSTFENKLYALL